MSPPRPSRLDFGATRRQLAALLVCAAVGATALAIRWAAPARATDGTGPDADSARLVTLDVLRDSAWVGGPCYTCGGWLPGGGRVWRVRRADFDELAGGRDGSL